MKTKIEELAISKDNPFLNDIRQNGTIIKNLTAILQASETPFVFALSAPWGAGKTAFVQMWKAHLECVSVPTYYFNAWECDHTKDALAAVLSEFRTIMTMNSISGKSELISTVMDYSKKLLKIGIPIAARLATMGAVDLSKVTEKELADLMERVVSEKLKEYESSKEDVKKFRESLEKAVSAISAANDHKPLFVFVDELDRCRPTFAIEILETAKHFFNVPGLIFVLSVDKNQLSESIKSVYGSGFDAVNYLKRFVDLEYHLVNRSYKDIAAVYIDKYHLRSFFDRRQQGNLRYEKEHFREIICFLLEMYKPTLRDIEKTFTLLSVTMKLTSDSQFYLPFPMVYLAVLRVLDPERYQHLVKQPYADETLLSTEYAFFASASEFTYNYPLPFFIEYYLDLFLAGTQGVRRKMEMLNESSAVSDTKKLEYYKRLDNSNIGDMGGIREFLLSRFEFTADFNA